MHNNGHTGPCIFSAKDVEIQFNLRGQTLTAVRRASLDLYEGETMAIVGEGLTAAQEYLAGAKEAREQYYYDLVYNPEKLANQPTEAVETLPEDGSEPTE